MQALRSPLYHETAERGGSLRERTLEQHNTLELNKEATYPLGQETTVGHMPQYVPGVVHDPTAVLDERRPGSVRECT